MKKLTAPDVPQKLLTMMATTTELEAFTYISMEEAIDERFTTTTSQKRSVLRRMIANDRALLKDVQKKYGSLLDGGGGNGDAVYPHVRPRSFVARRED